MKNERFFFIEEIKCIAIAILTEIHMPNSPQKILIISNDSQVFEYVHELLTGSDISYSFAKATTGNEGLQEILNNTDDASVSCVILDDALSDMSTFELLARLSEDGHTACPVIVLIENQNNNKGKAILRAGAQEFIHKTSLTSQGLLHFIECAIERHQLISEFYQREKQVRENEQRLTLAVAASGGGAWDWNFLNDTAWWSDEMYPLFGIAPGTSMRLENSLSLTHQDDLGRLKMAVEKAISEHNDFYCDYRIFHPQRGERWLQARGRVVFDAAGKAVRLQGVAADITEHKHAQERLRLNEERLRLATDFAEVGFWDVDLINDSLTWPPTVKTMFGISADVPVSMADFYSGLHPDDREITTIAFAAACDPRQKAVYDVEYRTIGKEDGIIRWVAAKGKGIFDENERCVRVVGTAINISNRKHAEQALRDSEARLRILTDNARVGLVVNGPDHRYRFVNQAYADILGLPTADLVGKEVAEVLPDVYESQIRPRLERAFSGETITYELVVPSHTDGAERRYAVTYQPAHQADEPIVIVVIYDVTDLKRAKEEAERARNLLEAFIEAVPGVVFAKDRSGKMLVANRGVTEVIGKPPYVYLGKTAVEYFDDKEQAKAIMEREQHIMEGGVTKPIEEEIRLSDGTLAVFFSNKAPLRNDANEIIGLISSSVDITARKKAEAALRESEAALRAFANAMPNLTWMAHADGWVFWYNQRWYEYTGTSATDMEGWGWEAVHDPDVLPDVKTRWMLSITQGTPFEMAFPLKGTDGQFRPFLTRAVPVLDAEGRVTRWFGSTTDISPERAIQAKLEASEIRLREADRRKDTFLATLAHELRNPLAPIRSAAAILAFPSITNEQLASAQQVIQRQVTHMAILLDDLLDVARITQDKLELRKELLQLPTIIDSAVEAVRPLLERKLHHFQVNIPNNENITLEGDSLRLSQVISNLLTNAAKYTDPAGEITLSAQLENGKLKLTIADNGVGISADALPKIFTIFSQAEENIGRSEGGLGIGLALAKGLIEMHGGTITAHSEGHGRGSIFTCYLPLVECTTLSPQSTANADIAGDARRVLIADDNADAADTLAMLIELAGHHVRVVYSGHAAITAAQTFAPEIAFLDIGMPDMNGCDVAHTIRQEPWGQHIYLVALTGWGQEEDRRKTTQAGFNEHLTKPIDTSHIMKVLNSL